MNAYQRSARTVILLAILASLAAVSSHAQTETNPVRSYNVLDGNKKVVVETSVTNDVVRASVYRKGKPAHHYRRFLHLDASNVHLGERDLFTFYSKTGRIQGKDLDLKLFEETGEQRGSRDEVKAVRRLLEEDQFIFRAVRGFDSQADTRLAELAYVLLTYDDSIMDGAPPSHFTVRQNSAAMKPQRRDATEAKLIRTVASRASLQ